MGWACSTNWLREEFVQNFKRRPEGMRPLARLKRG